MRLFIVFLFSITLSFGQVSLEKINLEHGEYTVGYTHYTAHDSTRTYLRQMDRTRKSIPRPIPISIWYPSNDKPKADYRLSILNYLEVLKEEEEWEHLPNEQLLNWFRYFKYTPQNEQHLKEKVEAYSNLTPVNTKFPVIIYASSYQATSIENFGLFEYLASHGYVIISSPSRGTSNKWLEGVDVRDMETQARDIEFLSMEVQKLPYVDIEKMATMGFSFGGLSNVLAQMRNDNIKAIVSLDGSIKYNFEALLESPYANLKKVDVPFVHFAQKEIPEEVLKEDKLNPELNYKFTFYDSLTNSHAYSFQFHHLSHLNFSTFGILFQDRDPRQDRSDAEIMESYKLMSLYTLRFLDAYLLDDTDALQYLNNDPVKNGLKKGILSMKSKKAAIRAYDYIDFLDEAKSREYIDLWALYKTRKAEHPNFELPEGVLNNFGLQLIFNPKTFDTGVTIYNLATTIYPNSGNLYDSLAEGYYAHGKKAKAIENFEKSLELDPQNQNAIDRIKKLRN